jgi:hypothetical protein
MDRRGSRAYLLGSGQVTGQKEQRRDGRSHFDGGVRPRYVSIQLDKEPGISPRTVYINRASLLKNAAQNRQANSSKFCVF